MSFAGYELSRQEGVPINLYYFRYGSDAAAFFAYTDADKSVTYDSVVYDPIPIKRGEIVTQAALDKAALKVSVPRDVGIANLYRSFPPTFVVSLTIREAHVQDVDFAVAWVGRVLSASYEDSICDLTCEPRSTTMRQPGLRGNWQFGCRHALYSETGFLNEPVCNADKTAATQATTVSAVNANIVRVPYGFNANPAHFLQGYAQWTDADDLVHIVTILDITDDGLGWSLYLNGDATSLDTSLDSNSVDHAISLVKGCGHNTTDCAAVHNNINNYGGQDKIPLKQPLGSQRNYFG